MKMLKRTGEYREFGKIVEGEMNVKHHTVNVQAHLYFESVPHLNQYVMKLRNEHADTYIDEDKNLIVSFREGDIKYYTYEIKHFEINILANHLFDEFVTRDYVLEVAEAELETGYAIRIACDDKAIYRTIYVVLTDGGNFNTYIDKINNYEIKGEF